jgi:hypothetical protein
MLFWREHFEDGHCPSPGLFAVPYLELPELAFISYVKPMENILPLSSELRQGKLTKLRCENRKILHANEIKKQTNGSKRCKNLKDLSNGTNKHLVRLSL